MLGASLKVVVGAVSSNMYGGSFVTLCQSGLSLLILIL
jgi:hypothetical protein